MQQESVSSESEAEESQSDPVAQAVKVPSLNTDLENWIPDKEPQLYLCDDWIQPVIVARKPRSMTMRANAAKNCLILTMMSLELGYGSIIERYQQARDAVVERYQQGDSETSVYLDSVILTDEEVSARVSDQPDEATHSSAVSATMPPSTRLEGIDMALNAREEKIVNIGNDDTPSELLFRSLNTRVLSRSHRHHRPKTR